MNHSCKGVEQEDICLTKINNEYCLVHDDGLLVKNIKFCPYCGKYLNGVRVSPTFVNGRLESVSLMIERED